MPFFPCIPCPSPAKQTTCYTQKKAQSKLQVNFLVSPKTRKQWFNSKPFFALDFTKFVVMFLYRSSLVEGISKGRKGLCFTNLYSFHPDAFLPTLVFAHISRKRNSIREMIIMPLFIYI
ncbi:hypothetical protein DM860_002461 [Cuscuta australis]|uniref:Uncharacterized protein n=1 Tax=Cuscuta australis TaxID=267555 RepID=A0A328D3L4_9ASTE|nr:hypothetical protein DM860_002461 [Cuscuta australis]